MASGPAWYLVFILFLTGGGLIFPLLRLYRYKSLGYPQFLFHLLVFSMCLFIFSVGLTFTGIYLRLPHLWRLFTALGYLNTPLCFLLFRVILTNRQEFRRTDLWVGVPPLIHLANMVPFIFSGREAKLEAVRAVMDNGNTFILESEGFLLPGLNSWLRAFVAISMIFGQMLMMAGAAHHFTKGDGRLDPGDRRLYRWLWLLSISGALSMIVVLLQFTLNLIPGWDMLDIIPVATAFTLLFIFGSIILYPDLLKGFKRPLHRSDLFF